MSNFEPEVEKSAEAIMEAFPGLREYFTFEWAVNVARVVLEAAK